MQSESRVKTNKIWIIAESEVFFLPHLCARLAQKDLLAGIIIVQFSVGTKKRISNLVKFIDCFGVVTTLKIGLAVFFAKICDHFCPSRFYSLKKVSFAFKLPIYNVRDWKDPKFLNLMETKVQKSPALVQVGRRVPNSLTGKYLFINKHCSILPKYKGIFPVFWCMVNGDPNQGVTLHKMDENFDTGPFISSATVENSGSFFDIYHKLYNKTYDLIVDFLESDPEKIKEIKFNEGTYYSYPSVKDRKNFQEKKLSFGWPFRFYDKIEK